MAKEIERKFLTIDERWRRDVQSSQRMRQGYIAKTDAATIRIRIIGTDAAFLTIKSANSGMSREEFEYPVPVADAEALMAMCNGGTIEKTRHVLPCPDGELTVDEFFGANAGLTLVEIELPSEDAPFSEPDWLGAEVTEDRRFYNSDLSARPFSTWPDSERALALQPA